MAVPLLTTKIVKKRVKHFKRAHSDRYIGLKVARSLPTSRTATFFRRIHRMDLPLGLLFMRYSARPPLLAIDA
jgi:hypothetical protein